jgi:hypothetical protein
MKRQYQSTIVKQLPNYRPASNNNVEVIFAQFTLSGLSQRRVYIFLFLLDSNNNTDDDNDDDDDDDIDDDSNDMTTTADANTLYAHIARANNQAMLVSMPFDPQMWLTWYTMSYYYYYYYYYYYWSYVIIVIRISIQVQEVYQSIEIQRSQLCTASEKRRYG